AVKLPEKGKFEEWKKGLMKELREKSFRTFPERIPPGDARPLRTPQPGGWPVTTEPGIELWVWPFPRARDEEHDGTVIVHGGGDRWRREEDFKKHREGAKPYSARGPGALLPPRGTGKTEWTRKSPPNYVARAHVLLGGTVDEGRVRDIAATIRWCQAS